MAFSISVKMETERAEKYLRKAAKKQLPFATAVALTKTAKHLAEVERRSLSKHLDRPTPFTKKAFAIKPARKQDFKSPHSSHLTTWFILKKLLWNLQNCIKTKKQIVSMFWMNSKKGKLYSINFLFQECFSNRSIS